jgi:hypothetical protein
MGGGKTHSVLAFGLLAADPKLRKDVLAGSHADFGPAKVVIFSGLQSPENLLWGHIAEKAGRPEPMARFWRNGAKTPGVDEWAAVLGSEPNSCPARNGGVQGSAVELSKDCRLSTDTQSTTFRK